MTKPQRVYCRSCNGWMIEFDEPAFEVVRRRDKVRVSYVTAAATSRTPEDRTLLDPTPFHEIVYDWKRAREIVHAWPEVDRMPSQRSETWTHIEVRCRCGVRWRFLRPT